MEKQKVREKSPIEKRADAHRDSSDCDCSDVEKYSAGVAEEFCCADCDKTLMLY